MGKVKKGLLLPDATKPNKSVGRSKEAILSEDKKLKSSDPYIYKQDYII
ncbi:hypothetical protein [Abyssisolibacter fermentans]|nr:hypothetical protein [Abyssisolibacter fermentans]